jgi:O-methyltransferase
LDRYGLLDDRVRFLVGLFEKTFPAAPIETLALLRLDGDMYGSTSVALDALYYPKLAPGGYVIVDDYNALEVGHGQLEGRIVQANAGPVRDSLLLREP